MEDNNEDIVPTPVVVSGANYNEHVIAEGASEFAADPSGIMNLIPDDNRAASFMQRLNENSPTHKIDPATQAVMQPDMAGNTDVMADLLRRMNDDAEHTIGTAIRDPELGPSLQRALITESFKDDEWSIQMNESSSSGKYKIVNRLSARSFFDEITLLEAAKKIAALLDNDHSLNSKKIQQVLYFDKVYENHYDECQNFKRLHKKAKSDRNGTKMNLMASKFDHAKEKALSAKRSIKTL